MGLTLSIIISTFNRCAALERTLHSVLEIDTKKENFEVLIVNNGSTDGTAAMVDGLRLRFSGIPYRFINEPMPGLLAAHHRGAIESKGDICIFIDDDVRLDPGWLDAIDDAFKDPSIVLAGGPSRPLFEVQPPSWLEAFRSVDQMGRLCIPLSLFDGGDTIKEIDPLYIFGLNFAIRRETLFDQGGFHPDTMPWSLQRYRGNGAAGLSMKIKQAGLKALYHPKASVRHEVPASRLTEEYFVRRMFRRGVAASYTQIRASGGISRTARWKHRLIRATHTISQRFSAKKADDCLAKTAEAYKQGFDFHQAEVQKDPTLLNWVLRRDYWDYRLPIGWEKLLEGDEFASRTSD